MPASDADRRFAARALRRKRLFPILSALGVAVAAALAGSIVWQRVHDPEAPVGARIALVILILLNARQNLRQYRFVRVLEGSGTFDPGPPR